MFSDFNLIFFIKLHTDNVNKEYFMKSKIANKNYTVYVVKCSAGENFISVSKINT